MSQDKAKRKTLPQKLRSLVWNKYIGKECGIGKCWCCKSKDIEQMEFQCGHVDSVKNGGSDDINNLRPICAPCNLSMGSTNMFDFMKILGTYEADLPKDPTDDKANLPKDPTDDKANLPKDPTDDKAAKKFVCEFCNMNFSHAPGLSRHKKNRCPKKQEMQQNEMQKKENEIKKAACLEEQLKHMKINLKELKSQIKELKNQNKEQKDQNKELKDQNNRLLNQLEKSLC